MNLAGIIDTHPEAAPALITESGQVTTYGALRREVASLQARLVGSGLGPDSRVAILSANDPAFVVSYLATLRAGAVAVPLNITSPLVEIQRQLAQVEVAAVLLGSGASHVAGAVESLAGVPVLTVAVGASEVALDRAPYVAPVALDGAPDVAPAAGPGVAPAGGPAEALAGVALGGGPAEAGEPDVALAGRRAPAAGPAESGSSLPAVDRSSDDLAALMFTAGTAGSPRAAMLTHGNLLANLDQVQRHPGRAIEASDRVLGVLPLSHIFGLNAVLGGALYTGASVVLAGRFEPVATLALIARHGVTILVGPPTLFAALAAAPSEEVDPTVTVRLAFSGAAPLSMEVADAWNRRFGLPLRQGYGLTEASPVVTTSVMDRPARPASIGVPLPGVEVRLVDDDGDDALAGDPGEIWVRGPNVFPGYWHDPEATEAALSPDGWLRTGDIAVVADDGELAIVDRAKDLIIVSGFNVYPAEVEDVLAEHVGVADAAVIGDRDPYRGEAVHAFVVPTDPDRAPTVTDLQRWCAARLSSYKCPTEITVVASLPHGLAGKLLRRSLRAASTSTPPASTATKPATPASAT